MIDPVLYQRYSKEKVDKALEILTYRKVEPLPKEESTEYPVIYIFRHGQSVDNANFIFSGWRKAPITEDGACQAAILAPKLRDKKIDMVISSPQIRALDTMKLAISLNDKARTLDIHTDPRIKERSYGDLQGESKLEYFLRDAKKLEEIRRSFDIVPPSGESIKMVCQRVGEFCDEIVPHMWKFKINVAVSCHGNSIRGFRRYFEGLSDYETAHIETPLGKDYAAYVIKQKNMRLR